jgi:hypothetical protein
MQVPRLLRRALASLRAQLLESEQPASLHDEWIGVRTCKP